MPRVAEPRLAGVRFAVRLLRRIRQVAWLLNMACRVRVLDRTWLVGVGVTRGGLVGVGVTRGGLVGVGVTRGGLTAVGRITRLLRGVG